MSRNRWFGGGARPAQSLTGLAAALVLLAGGSLEAAVELASPCPVIYEEAEVALNLGSAVDPPIVGNQGQFEPEVAFVSLGFSGNNARVQHGGDVELALGAGEGTASETMLRHLGSSSNARVEAAMAESTTTYVTGGLPSTAANYRGLRVAGLYPGVDLTYHLSSRQVILEYSAVSAAALEQVRLSFGGTTSGKSRDANQLALIAKGGERQLTVTAETRQAGKHQVIAPTKRSTLAFSTDALQSEQPVIARVVVTHGEYIDDFDAVALADRTLAVVSTAHGATSARTGNSSADLMVSRLSPAGDRLLSSMVVVGSGSDRAAAIAVDHQGQLVIAGTTDSADLDGNAGGDSGGGKGSRDAQAFVLQTSPDFGRVTRIAYLGHGLETSAADIAVSTAGEVLVLGRSAAALPAAGAAVDFTTLFPAAEGASPASYFLATLDSHTLTERGLVPFTGVELPSPPQVGFDAADLAVIGVTVGCGSVSVTCEYQMDNYGDDYDTSWILGDQGSGIIEQWGHYALQWKAYKGNTYNPQNAFPPSGSIAGAELDAERLNQNEAEAAVFPDGDPNGGWVIFESAGFGAPELAVGAALGMDWWTSPTFTSMSLGGAERPVGIRRVVFDVAGDNCLDVVCDAEGWNLIDDGNWQTNIVDNVDNDCAFNHDAEIEIETVNVATWQPFFLGNSSWAGSTFVNNYMPSRFEHVFDPPPGEEGRIPHLEELSSRLQDHMFVTTDILSTRYRAGKATTSQTVAAKVRVADLPTP